MPRLFVGLEIPDSLKSSLIIPRSGVHGARWQRDDQLHLTLAFIGDVSASAAQDIAFELRRISVVPFELALAGVGFFGKPGQPKALWAGVKNPSPVRHLHEKVSVNLERIGIQVDQRRFMPHVTLARFRRGMSAPIGNWIHDNERLVTHEVWIEHFSLFSSHLTEERAHYRIEQRYGDHLSVSLEGDDLWGYEENLDCPYEDWGGNGHHIDTRHS